jgi:hypothetical protein
MNNSEAQCAMIDMENKLIVWLRERAGGYLLECV